MTLATCIVTTGIAATAAVDLWALARKRLLGLPAPDYGLVGRWLAHMPRGRFFHPSIAIASPIAGERALGWAAHYLIGVAFAAIVPAAWGAGWYRDPDLGAALLTGLATVAAPFLLMQPGMGAGIAASRSARPGSARLQSIVTHLVFGAGLFASASLISPCCTP